MGQALRALFPHLTAGQASWLSALSLCMQIWNPRLRALSHTGMRITLHMQDAAQQLYGGQRAPAHAARS